MCGTVLPLCGARKIEHCELINYKDSWNCGNSSEGSAGSGTGSNNPSFIAGITVIV